MAKPQHYEKGLFVFHRDLRIEDNVGLLQACAQCERVYTCFIFTPEQIGVRNTYRSKRAIRFMCESLADLSRSIREHGGKLLFLYGDTTAVCRQLVRDLGISAIFTNKDYTPYATERDKRLSEMCESQHIGYVESADYYLYEPGSVRTTTGKYYQKFTPFYDAVLRRPVAHPATARVKHLAGTSTLTGKETTLAEILEKMGQPDTTTPPFAVGGRANGLARLRASQSGYGQGRDMLTYETTGLSAYLKFGCVSVREAYHSFCDRYGRPSEIVRQLIWRDFYAHVLYGFPGVLSGYTYKHVAWRASRRDFDRWKRGETGFPVVDACMRQLNQTGYMHNRGRMIVANFLVKTLLIKWKWGEEYFAKQLIDYDPASNNGNWQAISATGVDQKPYFRDMNPWIQSAKFDPEAEYIHKWVPELAGVPAKELHKWDTWHSDPKHKGLDYPKPMVDYSAQKVKMLDMYK